MVLEDECEHAVGGADRKQVECDRFDRNDDRAEGDKEQRERECEHERKHVRERVPYLAGEVEVFSGRAGNRRLQSADSPEGCRDQSLP